MKKHSENNSLFLKISLYKDILLQMFNLREADMKAKIICIFVMTLLIAVPFLSIAAENVKEIKDFSSKVTDSDPILLSIDWLQEDKLLANGGNDGDEFGNFVSICGDTAIIGSSQCGGTGAAYIFERSGKSWTQTKKLTASYPSAGDNFGVSVSIDGDYAIVGAYWSDDNGEGSGSAYIFNRNEGGADNWGQQAKLLASDAATLSAFGGSVSISGDTVIVGAINHTNDNGIKAGQAYIFEKPAGGWVDMTETAKLTASDGSSNDGLGTRVSIDGNTAIAGAVYHYTNGLPGAGEAYIFEKPGSNWVDMTETKIITASDAEAYDYFGIVAIDGDCAVVGAYGDYDTTGKAYIFYRNEGGADNWGQQAKLLASDVDDREFYGVSVSISGDTAIVGARDHNDFIGSAYIFEKPLVGWVDMQESEKITASDGQDWDQFGVSVSVDGNYAIVGAYHAHDDLDNQTGAAYVFKRGGIPGEGQPNCDECKYVENYAYQEFVPAVNKLLGVELSLAQHYWGSPDLQITIEKPLNNVLASAILDVSEVPEEYCDWIEIDLEPNIILEKNQKYYIVVQYEPGGEYSWCGANGNPYPAGESDIGPDWDWTFRTIVIKSKPKGVNNPFLHFLENFPILNLLIKGLLQRLELQ